MLSVDQLRRLESTRALLPNSLATSLTGALLERDPRSKLREILRFCESLARYLCDLLNSAYTMRKDTDPSIEKELRAKSKKEKTAGLSFGDLVASLAVFRGRMTEEMALPQIKVILSEQLPGECLTAIRTIEIIMEATGDFEVPPHKVAAYVKRRLAERGAVGKKNITDLLWMLARVRNAFHHPSDAGARAADSRVDARQEAEAPSPATGKQWWSEAIEFYVALVETLHPALVDLLLWSPLVALVEQYELVETLSPSVSVDDGFLSTVRRNSPSAELLLVPSQIRTDSPLESGQLCVAARTADPSRLELCVRGLRYPASRLARTEHLAMYRKAFVRAILGDAVVDAADESALEEIRAQGDLTDGEVAECRSSVLQRWLAACPTSEPIQSLGTDITPRPSDALEHWLSRDTPAKSESPAAPGDVVAQAASLMGHVCGLVLRSLQDNGAMGLEALVRSTSVEALALARALQWLVDRKRVTSAGSTQQGNAARTYQLLDQAHIDTFRSVLVEVGHEIDSGKVISGQVWRLIKLTDSLLRDLGHTEDFAERWRELEERALSQTDLEVSDTTDVDEEADRLDLMIEGTDVSAKRLTHLVRRAWELVCNDDRMVRQVTSPGSAIPFKVGRSRYFAHSAPEHSNGTAFALPVECLCGDTAVYFECNWSRREGVFHLIGFLGRCGFRAESASVGEQVVQVEQAAPEPGDESTRSRPGGVQQALGDGDGRGVAILLTDGEELDIRGRNVPRFLGSLLRWLVDNDLIHEQVHGEPLLPFQSGRVRNFVALAPFHQDETPFQRPVEYQGLYMEASQSWESALEYSKRLLDRLRLDCRVLVDDSRLPLMVRVRDGAPIEGENVRDLFVAACQYLVESQNASRVPVPLASGTKRYIMSETPVHPAGNAFSSPVQIDLNGRLVYCEANVSRASALSYVVKLLESTGTIIVDAQGHNALQEALGAASSGEGPDVHSSALDSLGDAISEAGATL